jgi:replicative DNA helicase
MSYFQDAKERIDQGLAGENIGLSTGMPKLDKLIGGVGRRTYTLVGANLGIGKTAFVDHAYVLMPYLFSRENKKGIKIRTFYYSFEIGRTEKILKWICYLVWMKYGVVLDVKEIQSKNTLLSADKYAMVLEMEALIDQMEEWVHIYDRPTNPTGLYMDLKDYAEKNGTWTEVIKTIKGHEIKTKKYVPNDPLEIVQYIEDHVGLARGEKELRTKKEKIDKGSEYGVDLRNTYGISKVAISQFNREIGDLDRRRFSELTPQLEDFKDSGNPAEDANIVIVLFNPLRYNLQEYSGMNVSRLGGRYRNAVILKHRDGADMQKHHLNFFGEIGHFREFPDPFLDDHYTKGREYKPWK